MMSPEEKKSAEETSSAEEKHAEVNIEAEKVHIVTKKVNEAETESSEEKKEGFTEKNEKNEGAQDTSKDSEKSESKKHASKSKPARTAKEKDSHHKAKKMAETDAELKYFLGLVDKVLLEIEKYSPDLPENEKQKIQKQFESDIEKVYKIFVPNAKPHDLALDYRFPEKLQTIEHQLQSIADRTWPGETRKTYRSRVTAWIADAMRYEMHPHKHFEETHSREKIDDLLDKVKNARIDGRRERFHKHVGVALAGIAGTVAGIGIETVWNRPSREEVELQAAEDVSESLVVEQVQGRHVKIRLPELPDGLVRFDIRVANPTDKIAILVDSFDPSTGVFTVPNSIQPEGGSIYLQVQVMIDGQGKSVLSSQKAIDGIGPVR